MLTPDQRKLIEVLLSKDSNPTPTLTRLAEYTTRYQKRLLSLEEAATEISYLMQMPYSQAELLLTDMKAEYDAKREKRRIQRLAQKARRRKVKAQLAKRLLNKGPEGD